MGGSYTKEKIEEFVSQMIADKGTEVGDEEKEKLINELNDKIDGAVIDALPDDKAIMLNNLLEEKGESVTEDEIIAVISGAQEEIKGAVEKIMNEFREDFLRS